MPNSYSLQGFSLGTQVDEIILTDPSGYVVDYISYDEGMGWPVGNGNRGHALELDDFYHDNELLSYWISSNSSSSPYMYDIDGNYENYGSPLQINSNYAGDDSDCAGVLFGMAFIDECGVCSGGQSGHEANSDKDCNGDCFGIAYIDECGVCSGGQSGHEANSDQDCNGDCCGENIPNNVEGCGAYLDNCNECVGGNTDLIENYLLDCNGLCPEDPGYIGNELGDGTDECNVCGGDNFDCTDYDSDCECSGCMDSNIGISADINLCCNDQVWNGSECLGGTTSQYDGGNYICPDKGMVIMLLILIEMQQLMMIVVFICIQLLLV